MIMRRRRKNALRIGVHRPRELLGTVRLVQDVVRQRFQVREMRAENEETCQPLARIVNQKGIERLERRTSKAHSSDD